jgi:hypothetical protein
VTSASPPPRHERTRQVSIRIVVLAALVPIFLFTGSSQVTASGILPGQNPHANEAPSPDFRFSGSCHGGAGAWHCDNPCVTAQLTFPAYSDTPACTAYVTRAIDAARANEDVRSLALPSNWTALTAREQLFVIANLERTARGLPPYLGLNAALNNEAQRAAEADTDPGLAPGFAVGTDHAGVAGFGGAWSSGFTTLGADYGWMYEDGWGGSAATTPNLACTSATAPGCWAHRDELLGYDPGFNPGVGLYCRTCEMGTGFAMRGGAASFTDLVELPHATAPRMTFTWAHDVVPYLSTSRVVIARERLRARQDARRAAVHGTWPSWNAKRTTTCHHAPGATGPFGTRTCRTTTSKTGRHRAVTHD